MVPVRADQASSSCHQQPPFQPGPLVLHALRPPSPMASYPLCVFACALPWAWNASIPSPPPPPTLCHVPPPPGSPPGLPLYFRPAGCLLQAPPGLRLPLSQPRAHCHPVLFVLVETELIYNVVLIFAIRQSDSVIHIPTYSFFKKFSSIMVYYKTLNVFSLLCSRILLFSLSVCSSFYLLTPASHAILLLTPPPWQPHVCSPCLCHHVSDITYGICLSLT